MALVLPLACVAACASPASGPRHATRSADGSAAAADGWPDTQAGRIARRWVQAFSEGEPAMRKCLPDILTAESLAHRSLDERIAAYRGLHDRFGTLMLMKVEKSTPGELVVRLAASDLSQHRFTFTVQTEAPFRLLSVAFLDRVQVAHGGHPF
jgi:hypothetical protein